MAGFPTPHDSGTSCTRRYNSTSPQLKHAPWALVFLVPSLPSSFLRLVFRSYIIAGGLMRQDEEGFFALDEEPDAQDGAEKAMAFAKVGAVCAVWACMREGTG